MLSALQVLVLGTGMFRIPANNNINIKNNNKRRLIAKYDAPCKRRCSGARQTFDRQYILLYYVLQLPQLTPCVETSNPKTFSEFCSDSWLLSKSPSLPGPLCLALSQDAWLTLEFSGWSQSPLLPWLQIGAFGIMSVLRPCSIQSQCR